VNESSLPAVLLREQELLAAALLWTSDKTTRHRTALLEAAAAFGAECQRLQQLELLALRTPAS
jgi:hypothetical protein